MKSMFVSIVVLVTLSVPAFAYQGTPLPANAPKASSFETALGTTDAPYSGWLTFGAQTVGGGGNSK